MLEGEDYVRVTQSGDMRTTICLNKFEVVVKDRGELWEQQVVQNLREWCRWRKAQEELRESRGLSE